MMLDDSGAESDMLEACEYCGELRVSGVWNSHHWPLRHDYCSFNCCAHDNGDWCYYAALCTGCPALLFTLGLGLALATMTVPGVDFIVAWAVVTAVFVFFGYGCYIARFTKPPLDLPTRIDDLLSEEEL